jgi:hypothetical protein
MNRAGCARTRCRDAPRQQPVPADVLAGRPRGRLRSHGQAIGHRGASCHRGVARLRAACHGHRAAGHGHCPGPRAAGHGHSSAHHAGPDARSPGPRAAGHGRNPDLRSAPDGRNPAPRSARGPSLLTHSGGVRRRAIPIPGGQIHSQKNRLVLAGCGHRPRPAGGSRFQNPPWTALAGCHRHNDRGTRRLSPGGQVGPLGPVVDRLSPSGGRQNRRQAGTAASPPGGPRTRGPPAGGLRTVIRVAVPRPGGFLAAIRPTSRTRARRLPLPGSRRDPAASTGNRPAGAPRRCVRPGRRRPAAERPRVRRGMAGRCAAPGCGRCCPSRATDWRWPAGPAARWPASPPSSGRTADRPTTPGPPARRRAPPRAYRT